MKAEYDLSKLKSRKNPYASKLKKPVATRLSCQQPKSANPLAPICLTSCSSRTLCIK